MTVQLRLKNSYIFYDDFAKSFINITAYNYKEDKTTNPFTITKNNFKKFRLCKN